MVGATDGEDEGFIRLYVHPVKGTIHGATFVCRRAGDLVSEVTTAIHAGLGLGDMAAVIGALNRARPFLREKRPFIWNSTNLSHRLRRHLIEFLHSYGARIRLVYLEAGREALIARNRRRTGGVPKHALGRMISLLDVPDLTECHSLELIVAD